MNMASLGCQVYEEGLVPDAQLPKENNCKESLVKEIKKQKEMENKSFPKKKKKQDTISREKH